MGVRELFSRGGQNFPGRGQKHTICLKSTSKEIFFSKKSKNILFWPIYFWSKGLVGYMIDSMTRVGH